MVLTRALSRRSFGTLLTAGLAAACAPGAAAGPTIEVHKEPNCQCCVYWVQHLRKAGFTPVLIEPTDPEAVRARFGVTDALASCHTATISGYVIEGHVPAQDILRLVAEKPKARGLVLPGMPLGSPGMESPTAATESYDVLLLNLNGSTEIFARH